MDAFEFWGQLTCHIAGHAIGHLVHCAGVGAAHFALRCRGIVRVRTLVGFVEQFIGQLASEFFDDCAATVVGRERREETLKDSCALRVGFGVAPVVPIDRPCFDDERVLRADYSVELHEAISQEVVNCCALRFTQVHRGERCNPWVANDSLDATAEVARENLATGCDGFDGGGQRGDHWLVALLAVARRSVLLP